MPLTRNGTIGFQVENVMAAVGRRLGLRACDWDAIRSGLASFVNDADSAPGRFNVMDYRGATVIADYGHNPDAMRALVARRRRRCRRSAARSSSAAPATVATRTSATRPRSSARPSTTCILYQDAAQRGRADGEVMALLRQGLQGAARTRRIDEIRGEFVAIDTALARLQPGDLCLVLVDQVGAALAHLAERGAR